MSTLCDLHFQRPSSNTVCLQLVGSWTLQAELPAATAVQHELAAQPPPRRLTFDTSDMTGWHSGLLTFLLGVREQCIQRKIELDQTDLPEGVQRLLTLATAVPERTGARRETAQKAWLVRLGKSLLDAAAGAALPRKLPAPQTEANLRRGLIPNSAKIR